MEDVKAIYLQDRDQSDPLVVVHVVGVKWVQDGRQDGVAGRGLSLEEAIVEFAKALATMVREGRG